MCYLYVMVYFFLHLQAIALNSRLKLSAFERDLAIFIVLYRNTLGREPSIKQVKQIMT